jgi:hypothetical protein
LADTYYILTDINSTLLDNSFPLAGEILLMRREPFIINPERIASGSSRNENIK